MKALRKLAVVTAIILLGVGGFLYSQKHRTDKTEPPTTYTTFPVSTTTTITEPAGTLTLHFTPTNKVVVAVKASTDKGYFSLQCAGRPKEVSVPGNGVWKSTACRLRSVHYSDNDVDTGEIVLKPKY